MTSPGMALGHSAPRPSRAAAEPILRAAALAGIELCLPKPAWSPDEQFHRAVTESLEEWWRDQGGRYEAVTVIGEEPSARGARDPRRFQQLFERAEVTCDCGLDSGYRQRAGRTGP